MKSLVAGTLIALVVLVAESPSAHAGTFKAANQNGVEGQYIVVLKPEAARLKHQERSKLERVSVVAQRLAKERQGEVLEIFENALPAFVLSISERQAKRLAQDPRVESVSQAFYGTTSDLVSSAVGDCYQPTSTHRFNARPLPSTSPQSLTCDDPDPSHDFTSATQTPRCIDNWGLDRIDQAAAARNGQYTFDRTGRVPGVTHITVFLIDTGVIANHDEFRDTAGNSRVLPGVDVACGSYPNCPPPTEDCTGHGTHVAAILGGRTYGVAKDVFIVPVRIDSCRPSSAPVNTIAIRALNWIAGASGPAVVNWSGGNSASMMNDPGVIAAAKGVLDRGLLIVQSAGNQSSYYPLPGGSPAISPVKDACGLSLGGTAAAGALVVGGTNEFDGRWVMPISDPNWNFQCGTNQDCGSNVGPCIDLWAPAGTILSASRGYQQAYCRLSGTSMAAPHVTGAAALYLQAHPTATPAQLATALINGATVGVLATSGFNSIGPSTNRLLFSKVP